MLWNNKKVHNTKQTEIIFQKHKHKHLKESLLYTLYSQNIPLFVSSISLIHKSHNKY